MTLRPKPLRHAGVELISTAESGNTVGIGSDNVADFVRLEADQARTLNTGQNQHVVQFPHPFREPMSVTFRQANLTASCILAIVIA